MFLCYASLTCTCRLTHDDCKASFLAMLLLFCPSTPHSTCDIMQLLYHQNEFLLHDAKLTRNYTHNCQRVKRSSLQNELPLCLHECHEERRFSILATRWQTLSVYSIMDGLGVRVVQYYIHVFNKLMKKSKCKPDILSPYRNII